MPTVSIIATLEPVQERKTLLLLCHQIKDRHVQVNLLSITEDARCQSQNKLGGKIFHNSNCKNITTTTGNVLILESFDKNELKTKINSVSDEESEVKLLHNPCPENDINVIMLPILRHGSKLDANRQWTDSITDNET